MSFTAARRASLAALLLVCLVVPRASASASARHDATEASIIRALNSARASHGLPKLRTSRGLARAADAHSKSMRRTNTMGHGDYSKRVRRYVRSRKVGENVAWMSGCNASAIVNMWLNSAPHRKIMLSKSFRRIGVGRSGSRKCFVTADFASAR
jgi:uncharacterized protein YkwD